MRFDLAADRRVKLTTLVFLVREHSYSTACKSRPHDDQRELDRKVSGWKGQALSHSICEPIGKGPKCKCTPQGSLAFTGGRIRLPLQYGDGRRP